MLCLSRKKNETIIIGDENVDLVIPAGMTIRITVVEVRGDKVRLGIEADRTIPVHREEVRDAIHRTEEAA